MFLITRSDWHRALTGFIVRLVGIGLRKRIARKQGCLTTGSRSIYHVIWTCCEPLRVSPSAPVPQKFDWQVRILFRMR